MKNLPLLVNLLELTTEPRHIYNRYELTVEDPTGTYPEKTILAADFTQMGGGMRLLRATNCMHEGRLVIAAYLQVSSLGHDLDQWALFDWETGERLKNQNLESWAEVETLAWAGWHTWAQVAENPVPNQSGVFEIRSRGSAECLLIGRAADLRRRLKYELIEGRRTRAVDEKIRTVEDTAQLEMRWAFASQHHAPFIPPAAIEAELLRRHMAQCGRKPKYTRG